MVGALVSCTPVLNPEPSTVLVEKDRTVPLVCSLMYPLSSLVFGELLFNLFFVYVAYMSIVGYLWALIGILH
jgi:hypothetical protein